MTQHDFFIIRLSVVRSSSPAVAGSPFGSTNKRVSGFATLRQILSTFGLQMLARHYLSYENMEYEEVTL